MAALVLLDGSEEPYCARRTCKLPNTDTSTGKHIVVSDYIKAVGFSETLDKDIEKLMKDVIVLDSPYLVVCPFAEESDMQIIRKKLAELGITLVSKKHTKVGGYVKVATIPQKDCKEFKKIFQLPAINPESLQEWQLAKLAEVTSNSVTSVKDFDELVTKLRQEQSFKDSGDEKVEATLRKESENAFNEIETRIDALSLSFSKKNALVLLIGPQCLGKSWISDKLCERGDFDSASADKHMGDKFDASKLNDAIKTANWMSSGLERTAST